MKKIAITGATGNFGFTLSQRLIDQGYHLKCLIRNQPNHELFKHPNIEVVNGDLNSKKELIKLVADCSICIHLAAQVKHANRNDYYQINQLGTRNLCQAIMESHSNCQLIYCSSIAAVKQRKFLKFLDTHYSRSKFMGELEIKRTPNLKYTIIQPGLIYGIGDKVFIPELIKNLKRRVDKKLLLVSGGEKHCPMIHIDDLCALFQEVIENKNAIGKSYIATGDNSLSIHEVFKFVYKYIGGKQNHKTLPKLPLLILAQSLDMIEGAFHIRLAPSISKRNIDVLSLNFKKGDKYTDLKWRPKIDNLIGLKEALAWIKQREKN